jgi:hypothetical protein
VRTYGKICNPGGSLSVRQVVSLVRSMQGIRATEKRTHREPPSEDGVSMVGRAVTGCVSESGASSLRLRGQTKKGWIAPWSRDVNGRLRWIVGEQVERSNLTGRCPCQRSEETEVDAYSG